MTLDVLVGVLLPLLGTALGSACVFFMKKTLGRRMQSVLSGFAAGVMVAASIWSLLLPAIEASSHLGVFSFVPATVGFWGGVLFLLGLDRLVPYLNRSNSRTERFASPFGKRTKMVLAVTLHNIPEGMAVGAAYAGYLAGSLEITAMSALALSMGIAIQNFPEGAILSMPLKVEGVKKGRSFFYGLLSGVVEPIFALLTIFLSTLIVPLLAYFLSFAAGAMLYVVVEELIAEAVSNNNADTGTLFFAFGFSVMMLLDVALG